MPIYLKKEERQMLFRKYKKSGLSNWDAQKRLDNFIASLNKVIIKLQLKKQRKIERYKRLGKAEGWIIIKSEEEDEKIEIEFRRNFEEMIQKLEI